MMRGAFGWTRSLVVLVPLLVACSGSQQNPENPSGETTETTTSDDMANADALASKPPPAATAEGGLNAAQRDQMELVLKRGGNNAKQCVETVPDGKGGKGDIKILFDGQKSRITEVTVGPPWAGTAMEACIQRTFKSEIIVPFDGDPLEVDYALDIPEKKGAAAADPKKPGKKP